jgi:hypothetical protein
MAQRQRGFRMDEVSVYVSVSVSVSVSMSVSASVSVAVSELRFYLSKIIYVLHIHYRMILNLCSVLLVKYPSRLCVLSCIL